MKQRLGVKKHKLCEKISGKEYESCWTRGGDPKGLAECWFNTNKYLLYNADLVNYITKEWKPYIRDGKIPKQS